MNNSIVIVLVIGFLACNTSKHTPVQTKVTTDSLQLFDQARNRAIPLTIYYTKKPAGSYQKIAIVSHGNGLPNTAYSAFANSIAQNGYVVVSIQHELPGDAPIPATGNVYKVRMPFWQKGADNILFVIADLKKRWPSLQYDSLVLIGHSNGGDMSMLFARQHPQLATRIISLDNRRMPFPRTSRPRIYSLRSSDQPADEGVLPTPAEQTQYGMRIIQLPNTIHNDMNDYGTGQQKKEIIGHILDFLKS